METIIDENEDSISPSGGMSIAHKYTVALERGVMHSWTYFSWGGELWSIKLLTGSELEEYKGKAQSGGFQQRGHNILIKKVTTDEVKARFRGLVNSMIKKGKKHDIDIVALQKIFTNQEIRTYFPVFSSMLPSPKTEMVESVTRSYMDILKTGLVSSDLFSAMANFNKAKAYGRQALPLVEPPQKLLVNAFISLTESLVFFCQGLIENEKVCFEETIQKLDEAVDIIPTAHYPLKLLSRALSTEDDSKRKTKISDAKKIASTSISQDRTPMENDLINFFLRFAEA